MKKILSLCFVFVLIVSLLSGFTMEVSAAGLEKAISGTIAKITYNQTTSGEEIRIVTSNTTILRQYVLPPNNDCKNYRLGFEIKDASIRDNGFMDVKRGSVVQIRYALKKDPQAVSIVVESTKKPEFTLAAASDGKSLVLKLSGTPAVSAPSSTPAPVSTPKPSATPAATPAPTPTPKPSTVPVTQPVNNSTSSASGPVSWSLQSDTCVVKLDGINLQQPNATGRTPTLEMREKEKILQITIPGRDDRFVSGILSGNSIIHGFLINYNDKLDATLVRISWKQPVTYTQELSNGSSLVKIKLAGGGIVAANPTPTPKPSATPTPTPKPSTTPAPTPKPSSTPVPATDTNRGESSRTPNGSAEFAADRITINTPITSGYRIYRVGSPARIILEVPCVLPPMDKLMVGGSLYQRATVTQMSDAMAKITLEAPALPQWTVSESAGRLDIALSSGGVSNLDGGNNDGQVALKITGPDIVNKYRQLSSGIVAENNTAQGVFAFMIPSGITTLGQGTVNMGDGLLNAVSTYSTPESSFLLLSKKNVNTEFKIVEGSNANELYVMVGSLGGSSSTPNNNPSGKKLIVLDPGHGGSDPGGDVGNYYEKTYNLDIAQRVESILLRNGYNVLMTRRSDVFVELEDRCKIANDSDAAFFVSIHNNKMPNPSYKGSMALYYPTSYKGKDYARIFLNNLSQMSLGGMGTVGLSPRGDLYVLKNTKMPAVLLEVACMTNQDDLNLLNTESFRQQVAENIANSIMQIGSTL